LEKRRYKKGKRYVRTGGELEGVVSLDKKPITDAVKEGSSKADWEQTFPQTRFLAVGNETGTSRSKGNFYGETLVKKCIQVETGKLMKEGGLLGDTNEAVRRRGKSNGTMG